MKLQKLYDKTFGVDYGVIAGIGILAIGGLITHAFWNHKIELLTHKQVEKFIDYGSYVAYTFCAEEGVPETFDTLMKAINTK